MEKEVNYYGESPLVEYQEKMKTIKELSEKVIKNGKEKKKDIVYSIDWLTVNIRLKCPSDIIVKIEDTYCQKRERGTNIFEQVRDFYNTRDELVFTICSNPHSSIIKPDFAQLQIYNKWLYLGNLEKLMYKIFFHSNFEYVNISRIDICADLYNFNQFNEKTNEYYTPLEFIEDFAKGNVSKNNPSKFTIWGKTDNYNNKYHCLNIGDHQSVFSWKLYNKSKEMKEVNCKPYIQRKWERDFLNYDPSKDVWRFEVSIKDTNKLTIKNKDIELVDTLKNWLTKYPFYFMLFVQKKFVFKDIYGKYIDFIKDPALTNSTTVLSTNLLGKFDYSPTLKDKAKILKSLVDIVMKADNRETCLEYIEKIEDYIQEEDYYMIFKSKGFNIDILYSYYVYKFTTEKMDLLSNSHGKTINT